MKTLNFLRPDYRIWCITSKQPASLVCQWWWQLILLPQILKQNWHWFERRRLKKAARKTPWCAGIGTGRGGAVDLAKAVIEAGKKPKDFHFLYPVEKSIKEKIEIIAREVYGATGGLLT
jgi:hypothetical protein